MRRLRQRLGTHGRRLIGPRRWRRAESELRCHPLAVAATLPRSAVSLAKQRARRRFPPAEAAASLLAVGLVTGCAGGAVAQTAGAQAGNLITVSAPGTLKRRSI